MAGGVQEGSKCDVAGSLAHIFRYPILNAAFRHSQVPPATTSAPLIGDNIRAVLRQTVGPRIDHLAAGK